MKNVDLVREALKDPRVRTKLVASEHENEFQEIERLLEKSSSFMACTIVIAAVAVAVGGYNVAMEFADIVEDVVRDLGLWQEKEAA